MQTITTIAELDTLIDETPALYARWSHGPDADAANGWVSRRWCPMEIYDEEGQVIDIESEGAEEAGLSATLVLGRTAIVRWHGDVHGETCYLLTGNEAGLCSDDEPLLSSPEPIAYVSMDLVNEIYDGLRLGAYR